MTLTSYNQVSIPSFMYGTAWKKDATTSLTRLAVESGFTAIDTANQLRHYQEDLVGEALLQLQKDGVKRETLFLQTKFTSVDGQDHRRPYDASASITTQVKQSMDSSLAHLHTDYVDSYVLHGPYGRNGLLPEDWEVWAAIENEYQQGRCRMIGVSNISFTQLSQLCAKARVKPMVVQNRCYAIMGWDSQVRDVCREERIIYQGFSLLTANQAEMSDPSVVSIAKKLEATLAQVIFAFAMKVGMLPLTGSTSAQHMKEDLKAHELKLTDEDTSYIERCAI